MEKPFQFDHCQFNYSVTHATKVQFPMWSGLKVAIFRFKEVTKREGGIKNLTRKV